LIFSVAELPVLYRLLQAASWKFAYLRAGGSVSLRPRLLASASFLISSLCAGALAQTAPSPAPQPSSQPADAARAATTPPPLPSAGEVQLPTAPAAEEAPAGGEGKQLPTIRVTAPKGKPARAKPAQAGPTRTATPPAPKPSPYETGAPNVAGGTPPVPQLASQMTISGAELNSRPVASNTETLEAAPGLAVVQHSGSGKANQYYLRGYNLDHGTDLAIFWDDVPINLPTNHYRAPWPVDQVDIVKTTSVMKVGVGFVLPSADAEMPPGPELLTGDTNIVNLNLVL
jgi:hypothetical protein